IRNTYDIRVRNKFHEARDFHFSLTSDALLRIQIEGSDDLRVNVPADSTHLQRVYVVAPANSAAATADRSELRLWVEDLGSSSRVSAETIFNGKGN
ncbi:MAG: FixG Ig-like domain-containing protein, partial [Gemmobacter sp.]|nr:FixG Ig-like domain-containing protein [Gemmobacter sp.]